VEPERFYDELADDYHLIFDDWDRSIGRQAAVLAGLLGDARTAPRIGRCAVARSPRRSRTPASSR
jgi:hypothetical protein